MLRAIWPFNGMARLSAFTVHEPPDVAGGRIERAESLLFVRDGFSWRAALLSPLYLLVRGEWLALAAYAAAATLLIVGLNLFGANPGWIVWMFVLLNVVTGFEGSELQRWALARKGWREVGTVSGAGREEAERRFFEAWLASLPSDPPGYRPVPFGAFPAAGEGDLTTRAEAAVQRLAARLRTRFDTRPKT